MTLALMAAAGLPAVAEAAFPGANGKIAFSSNRDDPTCGNPLAGCNFEIYVMNSDGSAITRLTNDPEPDLAPAWSPDGQKLLFQRGSCVTSTCDNPDTWVMNADGSGQTKVLDDGYQAAWSPDGTKIVFRQVIFPAGLSTANADGTNRDNIHSLGNDPSWSPDGEPIAFWSVAPASSYDVWTINSDGTGLTQLTDTGVGYDLAPNWSPDGERITYSLADPACCTDSDIMTMNADGSSKTVLTGSSEDLWPAWSADGSRIAFQKTTCVSGSGCTTGLAIINADGTDENQVTTGFADHAPDWQPLRGTAAFPRPGGGTPYRVPLVPAFRVCGSASNPQNSNHVAPLALDSCSPPIRASDTITTGTTGSMGNAFARYDVMIGNPGTPADEADLRIQAQTTDVRCLTSFPGCAAFGDEYLGSLILEASIRVTDRANGFGGVSATVEDTQFSVPMACVTTPAGGIGAACSVGTTSDAVVPGFVSEGRRTVVSALGVRVRDPGLDGDAGASSPSCPPTCGTGDERTFLDQGIFLP
jgi:TolB protein